MFGYANIGEKIKGLAMVLCIIEIIASVIYGIAIMSNDADMVLYGIIVVILGPVLSWISSWVLYGFGQLVENSDIIAGNSYVIANTNNIIAKSHKQKD